MESTTSYDIHSTSSIAELITAYAKQNNAPATTSLAIAIAESGLKVDAHNASSTASGIFEFINDTFQQQCINKYKVATSTNQKNDPFVQADCATKMIADGGLGHWEASRYGKHGWGNAQATR